ncbi:MAG: hypothetical protein KIT46_04610 [Anaerolineales bacterium]|nr:hypothetical protein [Anaerolineales bacterium]MCW5855312.1 hypothetical protein [Anaerolineales bacterium]
MSEIVVQGKPSSPYRAYKELAPQAPFALRELIAALGYPVEEKAGGAVYVAVETLGQIAEELSEMVGQSPAWGWRYLHGVLNQKQAASAKLTQAIFAWGAVVDGMPAVMANTQDVVVRAQPGQLHPGAVVLAASRRCRTCRVAFVPRVPWQRWCTSKCRGRSEGGGVKLEVGGG